MSPLTDPQREEIIRRDLADHPSHFAETRFLLALLDATRNELAAISTAAELTTKRLAEAHTEIARLNRVIGIPTIK